MKQILVYLEGWFWWQTTILYQARAPVKVINVTCRVRLKGKEVTCQLDIGPCNADFIEHKLYCICVIFLLFIVEPFIRNKIVNAKTRRMTMFTSGDDNLLCTSSLLDPNIRLSKSLRLVPPHAPLHDRFYVWCSCGGSTLNLCPPSCRNLFPSVSTPYDILQGLIIHDCVNLFHVHDLLGQLLVVYLSLQLHFALYVCTLGFE